jgi:mannan endo-1,4-beta-mannosidase
MGVGYSYAWTQDGSPIEGATESTFDAYQAGTYGVTISASGCADASSTVTLTTNFLNVPDVSGAENDVVTVTIHESGSFGWYNQENGGSQLGTGTTYDATVGASDYFLYVQDETGFVASVGKTLAPTTWTDNRFERMMKFETYTELNIDAITIYAVAEQDITINVLASDELTVVATKTFTNAPPGANRLQLDFNIPTAGTYYMSAEGSTGELEYSYEADTDISFPYTITDKISILGSNETWIDAKPYYLFFYDWQVSAGNTCARTPVKIESTGVTSNIIEIEAENATLHGVTVANSTPGYSGTGYVNGMDTDGDYIEFSINLSEGTYYKLDVTYNGGEKYQKLYVNSVLIDNIHYPATTGFETIEAASSILLQAGDNTIKIEKDWGWTDFDKITLTEIAPPEPIDYSTVTTTLIDSQANAKTYAVYNYLCSQYGENIISGQIDNFDPLVAVAGETPVIRAWDFQHYTVGYSYLWDNDIGGHVFGWEDDGSTQEAIDWYTSTNGKGIVSFQWHWHSPSGGTISTNTFTAANTTFDVGLAVQNGTIEHTEILRDIDSIATQLKKLEAAGVPVLWRPLHEAGGQWFWWGAGSATECLALWDIVYDRLTNYHNIHNLIWVWSTPEEDWYPGNSKVDIIGYDSYPGEYNYVTQKQKFDQLYEIVGGEKLVAMTENGPIPNPDDCISEDAMWSFFASWNDLVTEQNTTQHIQDVYAHNNVIVLDKVISIVLQNITLEAGWNLISTNVHPSDSTIETLFSGLDVNMIKNADSFWKAGQDINLNSLTKITSGKAYLVKMNVGGTLSIIGTEQTLHTTSVASGWQMMGCQYQTATSFTTDFNATNTTIIKNFDGFWEPESALNSITDLEPGKGYFVKGK